MGQSFILFKINKLRVIRLIDAQKVLSYLTLGAKTAREDASTIRKCRNSGKKFVKNSDS